MFRRNSFGILAALFLCLGLVGTARADPLYCSPNEGDSFSLQSGGTFSINDDCGTSSIVVQPSHGTLTFTGNDGFNSNYTYTATGGYSGTDTFVVSVSSSTGGGGSQGDFGGGGGNETITLNVIPTMPTTTDASASTPYNTAATIDLTSHITGQAITSVQVASGPAHGTTSVAGDVVTYTPAPAFLGGPDTFTYTATNAGGTSNTSTVTINVGLAAPTVANANATTPYNTPVAIDLTGDITGLNVTAVNIVTPAGHGTTAVAGDIVTYTPSAAFNGGTDTFQYTATNATGTSNVGTVTVSVGAPAPVAVSRTVTAIAGIPVAVDLTAGAAHGPFTGATLVSLTPSTAGTAIILAQGGRYILQFTATTRFSGAAVATFTISNAVGASAPATITFSVSPRPDPSQDPEVIGLVNAQAQAARRFADTQVQNFNDHLEQLHDIGDCLKNKWGVSVSDTRGLTNDPAQQALRDPTTQLAKNRQSNFDQNADGSVRPKHGSSPTHEAEKGGCSDLADGRMAVWSGGYVSFGTSNVSGTGGSSFNFTTIGVSTGADYAVSDTLILGAGAGFGSDQSHIGLNGTSSDGRAYSGALYASYRPVSHVFLDTLIGYGRLNFGSDRDATLTNGTAYGQRNGDQVFGSVTGGYELKMRGFLVAPYARLSASHSTLNSFTETGGSYADLTYGSQTIEAVTGFLGLRTGYTFVADWGNITPQVRLEYGHDFSGDSNVLLAYADDPNGQHYNLTTIGTRSNFFTVGAGATTTLGERGFAGFDYRTSLGQDGYTPHTFRLSVGTKF